MSATFLSISLLLRYLNSGFSSYRVDFNWLSEGIVCVMGGNLPEPSSDPGLDPSLPGACDTNCTAREYFTTLFNILIRLPFHW